MNGTRVRMNKLVVGFVLQKFPVCRIYVFLLIVCSPSPCATGMSRELFIDATARRLALVDPAEEIRQMFKAFDRGCRGFITRDDLRQVGYFGIQSADVGGLTVERAVQ